MKKTSIQQKIILLYLCTALIPLVLFVAIFTHSINRATKDNMLSLYDTDVQKISDFAAKELAVISDYCLRFSEDPKLKSLLNPTRHYDTYMKSIEAYYTYMEPLITNTFMTAGNKTGIKIYFTNKTLLPGYGTYIYADPAIAESNLLNSAIQSSNELIWSFDSENQTVQVASAMQDINGKLYSVVVVSLIEAELRQYFMLHKLDKMRVSLVNSEGLVVTSNDTSWIGTTRPELTVGGEVYESSGNKKPIVWEGERQFVLRYDLAGNSKKSPDWHVVSQISADPLLNAGNTFRDILIVLSVITLSLSCTCFLAYIHVQLGRLKTLSSYMQQMQLGEMNIIPLVKTGNEVGEIIRSYNYMVVGLKKLINDNYISGIKLKDISLAKQKAELYALQSQISPHFIFNLLEVVRMKLIAKNDRDNAKTIYLMSQLLRRSLSWKEEMIPVSEEVSFTQDYLQLQSSRFDGNLHYHLDFQEELRNYKVIKFVLQPLVENVIKHNNVREGQDLNIWVGASMEKRNGRNAMRLWVADDGKGASKAQQEIIRNKLSENDDTTQEESNSIGILNIHRRIRRYYGDDCGVIGVTSFDQDGAGWVIELLVTLEAEQEGAKCIEL